MALNVKQVAKLTQPGRYGDGKGLSLVITKRGAKVFVFRYMLRGERHDMGLGPASEISLAAAREAAHQARLLIRAGQDPLEARRGHVAAAIAAAHTSKTFDEVAALLIDSKAAGWRDPTNRQKWENTLRDYASPVFGGLAVSLIETAHVTAALEPIWKTKTETASRVRQRIESVLDYAAAHGWRKGANPARWKGHLDAVFAAPNKVAPRQHHAALPYAELPAFVAAIPDPMAGKALAFTILTAARTGEVMGARWREFDLAAKVWTVPGERMKAGRPHRVPLSAEALALLPPVGAPDALVFGKMAHTALREVVKRLGHDVDVHGFRSSFRDWGGERTNYPRETLEAALAHTIRNSTEAAYARGDQFAKRALLMRDWARYCASPAPAGQVVPIRA